MDPKELKKAAAQEALQLVESGMRLGVGTGSTADEFTKLLGAKVQAGFDVQAVTTSVKTENLCIEVGVKTFTLDELPELDLTIDGADELDQDLQLIKGGGGALLREKIVAQASKEMVVIADASKVVEPLGAFPLPIEVVPFGLKATELEIAKVSKELGLSGPVVIRKNEDGSDFVTDGGHFILDASFGRISDAKQLNEQLNLIPGVVETGLFIDIATKAVIAAPDGVKIMTK